MKKYILTILLACTLPIAAFSQNNAKFGHVSPEDIMEMIPGFDTAQKAMQTYQNDFQAEGEEMLNELQLKQQEFEKNSHTYSAAVRKIKEEEIRAMYSRIQDFSAGIEELLQNKKYELLLPFQTLVMDAIKEVAKEGNYAYIFSKSILSFSAQGDDITEKVKSKLGIK